MQRALLVVCSLVTIHCGGGGSGITPSDGGSDAAATPDLTSAQCQAKAPSCTDSQIQDQALFKKASTRKIDSSADGAVPGAWVSRVDASGGGFTPTESFVYAKFTDAGLVRVDIGDEAAFASTDWDIAFRRFLIRINSGVSGPSCVTAASVAAGTGYDAVSKLPSNLDFGAEDYYDAGCAQVPDTSGLGTPATRLKDFWTYPGCVQMTGQVYVLRLADGRHVKLVVTSYYAPATQTICDMTGSVPMGSPGGDVRLRWALLGNQP